MRRCGRGVSCDLNAPELPRYSLLSASRWTVILSIALATADNFAEPDLWIHMLTGQTILRTGHIPRFEAYSYSAAGASWHNHEWLSQVVLAFLYAHLGVFGLKILKLLVASILMLALAIGISATGASARVQRLTLILSAVAIAPYMQFRPQLFSFMLLGVLMTVVAIEVYGRDAVLWPLIPMFALWANFHGGYVVGIGAMGVASAVMFVQGWIGAADRTASARRLAIATVGCAAATLINPFGVGLWTGVAHSVGDPLIRKIMNDWVPLTKLMLSDWRDSPSQLLQYAGAMLMFGWFIVAVAMAPDLSDSALVAVATIFIGAAFYAARNVPVAVIAVAIPLAGHASLAMKSRAQPKTGGEPEINEEPPRALLAICAMALALVGGIFSNRLKDWKPMPTGALAFMQQHNIHGNILPQFEWGAYLIWHMGDQIKVFIDARDDLVYPDTLEVRYAIFFYGMDGAATLLDAYPHDYVLIGVHTKGADVVRKDTRWHLLYSDQTAALFGRNALPGGETVVGNVAGSDGKPADTYFP